MDSLKIGLLSLTILSFSCYSVASEIDKSVYQNECGACHIPYPTNFLSKKSWDSLLNGLSDHFGDNAELDADNLKAIKRFVGSNNFDQSSIKQRLGNRFDTPGVPLRVTETKLFTAIHHEVSTNYVKQNPKIQTFANCQACHTTADKGDYSERRIRIPR